MCVAQAVHELQLGGKRRNWVNTRRAFTLTIRVLIIGVCWRESSVTHDPAAYIYTQQVAAAHANCWRFSSINTQDYNDYKYERLHNTFSIERSRVCTCVIVLTYAKFGLIELSRVQFHKGILVCGSLYRDCAKSYQEVLFGNTRI